MGSPDAGLAEPAWRVAGNDPEASLELSPSYAEIALRLVLAMVLGGTLGIERELHRKPAGLRTHMMVAMGSAAFTLVAVDTYSRLVAGHASLAQVDPLRLIQGIIGGIGFLGAGSIIQSRGSVEGLTTASTLWFVGAVGVATGGGHYAIACIAVALGLIVLLGVGFLEARVLHKSGQRGKPR
jgi:putative Mg2+ transporter-C (MgtC) family protein